MKKTFEHHVNEFGNIDAREKLPKGYVHVPGKRLGPLARKVGAKKWAIALTGFEKGRSVRHWRAVTDGIVCSRKIAPKIKAELTRLEACREAREAKSLRQRERRQERDRMEMVEELKAQFPHLAHLADDVAGRATAIGSGRVGRTNSLSMSEKARRAMVSHVRHAMTDYDELLQERPPCVYREEWREECRDQVSGVVRKLLTTEETS